jgi:amino acid adenylation domain-containing protein
VLRQVVECPELPLSQVELLSPSEREELAARVVRPSGRSRSGRTVVDLFEHQARTTPDAIALEAAGSSLTYRELDARASALALQLRRREVGPGKLVGICLHRGAGLVAAMLGVLKSGAAYVPLDPSYPHERLDFMLRDSAVAVVVTEPALAGMLPPNAAFVFANAGDSADALAASLGDSALDEEGLAYVIYTSGSTGTPKGVEVTHRALANVLASIAARPGLSAGDRLLAVTTVSFDIAALEILLPLISGATVVMAARDDARDAGRLAALISQARITVMQATPSTWRMLIDAGWRGQPGSLSIWSGGEALSRELAEALIVRGRSVWNLFGPTETTIWSTVESVSSGSGPVSIGRPIANTEIHVLDAQGRPAPTGVPGELFIGGDGVARGYLNRPGLTAERFVRNSIDAGGGRLYRTGDRVRMLPDGRLQWLGRVDSQLKIRGHRVEIGEIEACLGRLIGVSHCAVVPIVGRDGTSRLVGFVVASETIGISGKRVRDHLARELPSYMVPARVDVIRNMPMTPNQKVDRGALARLARFNVVAEGAAGESDTERRLCEIWAELLDVPQVGVDDDFFDLGGHSLLAVRLALAIERELGQSLSVAKLIDARTVRQAAALIERAKSGPAWQSLVIMQPEGAKAPFYCVHGVGGDVLNYQALASRMGTDRPFVSVQAIDQLRSVDPERGLSSMAAAYVDEIRRYQPSGPYHLGGYSLGGRIALEMALQLEAAGERVAFLGILDATPQGSSERSPGHLWRCIRNVPRWLWHDGLRSSWRENADRLQRGLRRLRSAIGMSSGEPAPGLHADVREMMNIDGLPIGIQRRYEWDFRAYCSYRPPLKCGPVTVFKASAQPLLALHASDLGWSAVSRGPVSVIEVPGSHSSIIAEPGVQHLADALKSALDPA